MSSYTVTITPDDPTQAVTTIRLDLDGAATTVRELRLAPGSGGTLMPGALPVLDLNQLVAAVLAATSGAVAAPAPAKPSHTAPAAPAVPGELEIQAPAADTAAPKPPARKRAPAKTAAPAAAAEPVPPTAAEPAAARRSRAGRPSAVKADTAAAKPGAAKTASAKASTAKPARAKGSARGAAAVTREKKASPAKATAKKSASSTPDSGHPSGGSRSYRKLPDDFEQVLRQAGDSASVIADHYDVPRHTAYGWIRTARKKATTA
ncbi:hypothetical protein Cme02nite_02240 [Catellatospora methionotrophica]|uniref:Uncharacterized protein n=1 Tax=Catellatospora methionotrophica TaxID=121620 RepID=A0A8J3KZM6_9ACTN|nr:hypothetical protein [Catellatospora methionotrophica]GIG11892.1 hypothetical protein Cme02nite_02240 [Catellatospora methionotrophica]